MFEIVNNFLWAGDKFIPQMHLKRPGFTYSACGPFTDKVNFLTRTFSDKVLGDKSFNFAKTLNMMGITEDSLLWFTSFLIKNRKVVVLLIMRLNKIYN